MEPNEAIKVLQHALRTYRPEIAPRYIAADLADLRLALVDDELFADAVAAIAHNIGVVAVKRDRIGTQLEHGLALWRRHSFTSPLGTDLRIIYQPLAPPPRLKILGFGDRHLPHSVYYRMLQRILNLR